MGELGRCIMSTVTLPDYISMRCKDYLLIKICKTEEYREDFVSGKLYMSTIKNIGDIERKELSKGQCDDLEGTEEYWQSTEKNFMAMDYFNESYVMKYFDEEPKDQTNLVQIHNVKHGRGNNIYKNIYCMYSAWLDVKEKQVLDISEKLIDNFGEYATIILDPFELIERYNKAISVHIEKHGWIFNSKPSFGFVNYLNLDNKGIIRLGVYKKRDNFKYQNEFRFCLDIKDKKNDLCYFEIGDLSDIVVKVKTIDLVSNIKFEDVYLSIGDIKLNFNLPN